MSYRRSKTPSVKCWTLGIFLIMEICNSKDSVVITWMGFPRYSQNSENKTKSQKMN